jgi:hypothetical protein
MITMKKKKKKNKEICSSCSIDFGTGYDPYGFNKVIDDALGTNKREEEEDNSKLSKLDKKIKKATEIELFKLMSEGKRALISEFKYRRPDLREWVGELEYQYWSRKDQDNSQWKLLT